MAEAVVFYVLQKIGSALADEAMRLATSGCSRQETSALLEIIKENMKQLEREFRIMKAFIERETQQSHGQAYDTWLDNVKSAAHDAEDVIDEYAYLTGETPKKANKLKRLLCRSSKLDEWRDIAKRLKQIQDCLQNLMNSRARYGISESNSQEGSSRGQETYQEIWLDSTYFDTKDDIVGNKEETTRLTQLLLHGPASRSVISILGMGGIGKTTLARGVYKSKEVENVFDCFAWMTISQNYRVDDLLRGILKKLMGKEERIPDQIDIMDRISLAESLKSYLQDKRYLIILDDIWSREAWTLLDRALVSSNKGSRVLITTRIEDVASIAQNGHCIVLKKLPSKDAWDLFCQKAFPRVNGGKCPEILIPWAEKIVQRCGGLPLAVVAIGSMLAYKDTDQNEWKIFYNQLSWYMSKNQELNHITSILNLSFNSLPGYLKNCFMYCSLFPEDYVIRRKQIIRLWIAEGFVEERGESTTEEVAEEYLKELVHRSLLQVVLKNMSGRAKGFQMHDIVREITVAKCRSDRFSHLVDDPCLTKLDDEARRVSLLKGAETVEATVAVNKIRSFILFDEKVNSAWIQNAFAFRLLRVLSLRGANIEKVPSIITDLYNLNYLDLRHSKVEEIPKSVGNLRKLQLLDISYTKVMELPGEIKMLTKLRFLKAGSVGVQRRSFHNCRAVRIRSQICHLNNLQVLGDIVSSENLVANLGKLTQLRTFGIYIEKGEYLENICTSVRQMPNLVRLGIVSCTEDQILDLNHMGHVPSLEWLRLRGKLHGGTFPSIFCSFNNVRFLSLEWSRLQEDPLPCISHMRNLGKLSLQKAYDGVLLTFRAGWFPVLKELMFHDMEHLSFIEMEAGTMQILDYVELDGLRSMVIVPSGFKHLTTLLKLILRDMPEEFISRARGVDRPNIQHIPTVLRLQL